MIVKASTNNQPTGMTCYVCGGDILTGVGYEVDALGERRHTGCELRAADDQTTETEENDSCDIPGPSSTPPIIAGASRGHPDSGESSSRDGMSRRSFVAATPASTSAPGSSAPRPASAPLDPDESCTRCPACDEPIETGEGYRELHTSCWDRSASACLCNEGGGPKDCPVHFEQRSSNASFGGHCPGCWLKDCEGRASGSAPNEDREAWWRAHLAACELVAKSAVEHQQLALARAEKAEFALAALNKSEAQPGEIALLRKIALMADEWSHAKSSPIGMWTLLQEWRALPCASDQQLTPNELAEFKKIVAEIPPLGTSDAKPMPENLVALATEWAPIVRERETVEEAVEDIRICLDVAFRKGRGDFSAPRSGEAPREWPARFWSLADRLEDRACAPSLDGYDLVDGLRAAANLMTESGGSFVHVDEAADLPFEEAARVMLRDYESRRERANQVSGGAPTGPNRSPTPSGQPGEDGTSEFRVMTGAANRDQASNARAPSTPGGGSEEPGTSSPNASADEEDVTRRMFASLGALLAFGAAPDIRSTAQEAYEAGAVMLKRRSTPSSCVDVQRVLDVLGIDDPADPSEWSAIADKDLRHDVAAEFGKKLSGGKQ